MDSIFRVVLSSLALACCSFTVSAQVAYFDCFPINAMQVVPPNGSPATGFGSCSLNQATDVFTWDIGYSGLIGIPTGTFFHAAPPGSNGPIIFPVPTLTGSFTVNSSQMHQILAGNFYVSVHTTFFPGGEVRGQVIPNACPWWQDLGDAKPGVDGPHLSGTGPMTGGSLNKLKLVNAKSGTSTTLIVGFSAIHAPFKGGVLVPAPSVLLPGLVTSTGLNGGQFTLPFIWPNDPLLVGFNLYWQQWIPDAFATQGLDASNGLKSTGQ